jgi:hypothetical protein
MWGGIHLFSKIVSKDFSSAVKTAVLVSLYLSAKIWINCFAFSLLKFYFKRADRCSTVLIASINTSMLGSSKSELMIFKIFE